MTARKACLFLAVGFLLIAGVAPLAALVAGSVAEHGRLGAVAHARLLATPRTGELAARSLLLAGTVTALCTALGVGLGLVFARTDIPGARLGVASISLPLLLPPYVVAVAWSELLGSDGPLAPVLSPDTVGAFSGALHGLPGCVLVHVTCFTPLVMLLTMVQLGTVDPRLEEAGRLTARWRTVLRGVTLPMIFPGVALASTLVFLLSLGEISVPLYLGYDVFALESFTRFTAWHDFAQAAVLSVPLAAVALLVLAGERWLLRRRTRPLQPRPGGREGPRVGGRKPLVLLAAALGIGAACLPLLHLAVRSLAPGAYAAAWDLGRHSLARSLLFGAAGATWLTGLGFLLAAARRPGGGGAASAPRGPALESTSLFLFALPAPVLGIGLIALWNHPATNFVYGTPLVLLLGAVARFTAVTSRTAAAGLARIPASMEEAAALAGAGWLRRQVLIRAPLAWRALAGGWLVGFLFCVRDTGVPMLVYPPGEDPLSVRLFTVMANGEPAVVAALCMFLLAATALPLLLLGAFGRPRRRPCAS